jgi:hypothetical protein
VDFVLVNPGFSTRVGPDMRQEAPCPTEDMRADFREQQQSGQSIDAPDTIDRRPPARPESTQEDPQQTGDSHVLQ